MASFRGKRKSSASRKEGRPLKEAVVLIPLTYNDGSRIPPNILESIQEQIYVAFGGHTIEGTVKGTYRMQAGQKRVEDLVRISIILDERRVPELEQMVGAWAVLLGQETMLLKLIDSVVKFIEPRLPGKQT